MSLEFDKLLKEYSDDFDEPSNVTVDECQQRFEAFMDAATMEDRESMPVLMWFLLTTYGAGFFKSMHDPWLGFYLLRNGYVDTLSERTATYALCIIASTFMDNTSVFFELACEARRARCAAVGGFNNFLFMIDRACRWNREHSRMLRAFAAATGAAHKKNRGQHTFHSTPYHLKQRVSKRMRDMRATGMVPADFPFFLNAVYKQVRAAKINPIRDFPRFNDDAIDDVMRVACGFPLPERRPAVRVLKMRERLFQSPMPPRKRACDSCP